MALLVLSGCFAQAPRVDPDTGGTTNESETGDSATSTSGPSSADGQVTTADDTRGMDTTISATDPSATETADTDLPVPFCEGLERSVLVCTDFDMMLAVPVPWTPIVQGGSVNVVSDDEAPSIPHVLRASASMPDSDVTFAGVRTQLGVLQYIHNLSARIHLDDGCPAVNVMEIAFLTNDLTPIATAGLEMSPTSLRIVLQVGADSQEFPVPVNLADAGPFVELRLEVDFTTDAVRAFVDGNYVGEAPLIDPAAPEPPWITVGVTNKQDGTCEARIDDILVY